MNAETVRLLHACPDQCGDFCGEVREVSVDASDLCFSKRVDNFIGLFGGARAVQDSDSSVECSYCGLNGFRLPRLRGKDGGKLATVLERQHFVGCEGFRPSWKTAQNHHNSRAHVVGVRCPNRLATRSQTR